MTKSKPMDAIGGLCRHATHNHDVATLLSFHHSVDGKARTPHALFHLFLIRPALNL